MKKTLLFLFALLVTGTMNLLAVNVKDFGAAGDGITDDTDAIQRALDQVRNAKSPVLAGRSELPEWGGHGGHGSGGEVYLPAGTYRLTRPLVYDGHNLIFRGEPGTTLIGAHGRETLYFHYIFRLAVENIHFLGGARQLNLFTNNGDMAMMRLENCTFENAEKESIRMFNARAAEWRGVPPYLVKREEGKLPVLQDNPEYAACPDIFPNSTLFSIIGCTFKGSCTFLLGGCDQLVVEDTAFERKGGTAPILQLYGQMNFRNVKAAYSDPVPGGPSVWLSRAPFDGRLKYSSCFCSVEKSSFLCAAGAPLALLRVNANPDYITTSVRVLDSEFDLAGAELLRMAPKVLIGLLEVRNNRNLGKTPLKAVVSEELPTAEEINDTIRYFKHAPADVQFRYFVANNQGFDETLPPLFQPFRCKPIPQADYDATLVKVWIDKAWPQESAFSGKVIRPAFKDGVSDTEALSAAFAEARTGDRIVLPGRKMELADTLKVPAGVEITAEGMALLTPAKGKEKALQVLLLIDGDAKHTLFRNIVFAGGQIGVEILSSQGTFAFQNCLFLENFNTGVQAMGKTDAVLLKDCLFFSFGGVRTNAKHSEIRRSWVCNHPLMEERAFFANSGGEMAAEYNLFVPIQPRVDIGNFPQKLPRYSSLLCENNIRWFDNYGGRLYLDCNRLGAEFGGMPAAYLYGNNAALRLQGSFCWFANPYTRRCMVYCHDTPRNVVLNGVICCGEAWLADKPYNVTGRDPATGADLPGMVRPEIQGTALIWYKDNN